MTAEGSKLVREVPNRTAPTTMTCSTEITNARGCTGGWSAIAQCAETMAVALPPEMIFLDFRRANHCFSRPDVLLPIAGSLGDFVRYVIMKPNAVTSLLLPLGMRWNWREIYFEQAMWGREGGCREEHCVHFSLRIQRVLSVILVTWHRIIELERHRVTVFTSNRVSVTHGHFQFAHFPDIPVWCWSIRFLSSLARPIPIVHCVYTFYWYRNLLDYHTVIGVGFINLFVHSFE